jgi:hypothetical protein
MVGNVARLFHDFSFNVQRIPVAANAGPCRLSYAEFRLVGPDLEVNGFFINGPGFHGFQVLAVEPSVTGYTVIDHPSVEGRLKLHLAGPVFRREDDFDGRQMRLGHVHDPAL